jgi:hypothetical protein
MTGNAGIAFNRPQLSQDFNSIVVRNESDNLDKQIRKRVWRMDIMNEGQVRHLQAYLI